MSDVFERDVYCLLGLPFDAIDTREAARKIRDAAWARRPCFLSTPNINWVVACLADEAFRDSAFRSDLCVVDGMPLVWVGRLLGIPIPERVAGSGLFETLRNDKGASLSVFFFGGPEGVAEIACRNLNADLSGVRCVGFECPGFGTVEDMSADATISKINRSCADFLVVALGARKGQTWIVKNQPKLTVPIISHLGAVVDFVAGRVSRAPFWVQRVGLEWLWRIKEDPGLWRRYFFDGLIFLHLLVTRILPFAWFIRAHRPSQQDLVTASIGLAPKENETILRLSGAWTQENLGPVRKCFSEAVVTGKDIRLDMESVRYVDSAFVGLTLLLHGQLARNGRRLLIASPPAAVLRIFKYCCVENLCATTG